MTRQDKVIAAVRSAAAYAAVLLIGWLLSLGIDLPDSVDGQILLLAPILGVFLYNYAANWLASRWPILGFLLLVPKQPAYDPTKPVLVPDTPPGVPSQPVAGDDRGVINWVAVAAIFVILVCAVLLISFVDINVGK